MTGFQREVNFNYRSQEEIEAEQARLSPVMTQQDHDNLDAFLNGVLDDFSAGKLTKFQVVQGLGHVFGAMSKGNYPEARHWFEQGRKLIRGDYE